jgi:hypothetical protein
MNDINNVMKVTFCLFYLGFLCLVLLMKDVLVFTAVRNKRNIRLVLDITAEICCEIV